MGVLCPPETMLGVFPGDGGLLLGRQRPGCGQSHRFEWSPERPETAQVHLLVRGKRMRASAAMQDRALRHDKVQVHFNTSVRDAYGDKKGLKGLVLYDTDSGGRPGAVGLLLLVHLAYPWTHAKRRCGRTSHPRGLQIMAHD